MHIGKRIGKTILQIIRADPVLVAALLAAVVSAFFVPPSLDYIHYIDLRVLCLLLSLMLVVAGLQRCGLFDFFIACLLKLVGNTRSLAAVLIGLCFFSSMWITNDVALLTFVPLAVLVLSQIQQQRLLIPVLVLQTIAANLGSMLTPLGNPQNLYLYALANMQTGQFLRIMALPTGLSFILLIVAVCVVKREPLVLPVKSQSCVLSRRAAVGCIVLFGLCLLAVVRLLPYGLVLAVVVLVLLLWDFRLFACADYGLLLTFVFFFIFVGNLKAIPAVSNTLSTLIQGRELGMGILLSQVISNVPAAMLLSGFSSNYPALLLGVNVGGLGTVIASMASLISYKFYAHTEHAKPAVYLVVFTAVNVLFGAVLWLVSIFWLNRMPAC